jgi:hypothetical protein
VLKENNKQMICNKIKFINFRCIVCEEGTYSMLPNSFYCQSCPRHASCPGGNKINVDPGYWRVDEMSSDIIECLYAEACIGGTEATGL